MQKRAETIVDVIRIDWTDFPPNKVELRRPGFIIIDGISYRYRKTPENTIQDFDGPPVGEILKYNRSLYKIELILSNYYGDLETDSYMFYPNYLIWPDDEEFSPQTIKKSSEYMVIDIEKST